MRKPIIAGNWKMYKTQAEAAELASRLVATLDDVEAVDVVIAPPFVHLPIVASRIAGSRIGLAAQNLHWETWGAFTGEISAAQLKDLGCQYAIIGHSERRQFFLETDALVNRKVRVALAHDLTPIVCIGESLAQRQANLTMSVVEEQLAGALEGLPGDMVARLVLAYEPVWAIGTGLTASDEQAQEVHACIRAYLARHFAKATADAVRIQYGGSVKPANAAGLLTQPDIDGCLVGGASLQADSFAAIVRAAL